MTIPTIYGDGIHDDAPALQAAIDGLPFNDPNGLIGFDSNGIVLKANEFLIDGAIDTKGVGFRTARSHELR